MTLESINPANGQSIKTYPAHSDAEVEDAIDKAVTAFKDWRHTDLDHRAACMRKAADILRINKQEYGLLVSREMGKPVKQAIAEIEKSAQACDHYADKAREYLAVESVQTSNSESYVAFEPLGVILAVMPWNFPFWQVIRFAAPALMAGNAGLLKHASNVSGCALAIEAVFHAAGFPAGLFKTLLIESKRVEAVVTNPAISAVTLTGSGPAGSAVASAAGMSLKKSVLELGGNDAYVVLKDADLLLAARICVQSRMNNAGQSCIAAKRLIVEAAVVKEFESLVAKELADYVAGDPEQEDTTLGPLARPDLREELQRQVDDSIAMGAICVLGGKIPEGDGAYYPATLLTNVTSEMPAFREELFGPVACIISARDEATAIQLANDSLFGLGAAVFSRDIEKAKKIATHQLEAGTCVVNDFVRSDALLPFGGIKQSGYGRELSHFGIREFVNVKTVYVGPASQAAPARIK
ncbi:MAG: succinate-semialdehyde dehydrogenase/glutarate-semialdehyde dehydrogenase [Planctomycetota bacterium]|jgi:succinate-semialdehyde dehydrogenase/glutarate-semialdehyde dehydrogenase